jgi:TM2 domain-containing membrane protein YozV
MKKAVKAALLSGLIYPGLGQLWLKHPIRGIVLMVAVSASLAAIVTKVAQQALTMLEKMEAEGGTVDLVALLNLAHATSYDDFAMKCASLTLIACWAVSIVDAYVLGREKDRQEKGKYPAGKAP